MNTFGLFGSCVIAFALSAIDRQRNLEGYACVLVVGGGNFSTVTLDDRPAYRKANAHALGFACIEGLEQIGFDLGIESRTVIGHRDNDMLAAVVRRLYHDLGVLNRCHGVKAVAEKIDKDLLYLDAIDQNGR
jgi:hypothetical protein